MVRIFVSWTSATLSPVTQDDDCYESSALQQAIKLGYFEHITEGCVRTSLATKKVRMMPYREHVDNAITAFCDFPGLTKLTLDGLSRYLSDASYTLKTHIYVSLLDINASRYRI
jgi:hypothetical protein